MHLITSFEGAVSVPKNTVSLRGSHDPYARRLDPKWPGPTGIPDWAPFIFHWRQKTGELHPQHHESLYNITEYTFKKTRDNEGGQCQGVCLSPWSCYVRLGETVKAIYIFMQDTIDTEPPVLKGEKHMFTGL